MTASLPSGASIAGRFTIEAAAGCGSMGAVYRACDQRTGKPVAIKLLHADRHGAQEQERFSREIQILAGLRHPGIVAYIAHGCSEAGRPYLVMEWLDGEDLAQRLRTRALTLAETLTLFQRLAQALTIAHRRQIVHRVLFPPSRDLTESFQKLEVSTGHAGKLSTSKRLSAAELRAGGNRGGSHFDGKRQLTGNQAPAVRAANRPVVPSLPLPSYLLFYVLSSSLNSRKSKQVCADGAGAARP